MSNRSPATKSLSVGVRALDAEGDGEFEALLSTPDLDLEGDALTPEGWETPLPSRIPINVDHKVGVLTTIGSAVPSLDADGNLIVRGMFASTAAGQEVRTLVREGHISTMSVEFLQYYQDDEHGNRREGRRTLTGGAFTPIPANPKAVVLSAKDYSPVDITERLGAVEAALKSLVELVTKAVTEQSWDGSASRFTLEQWRRSCLIGPLGDPESKGSYKLPVKEPDGTINRRAVHAAAAALAGGRGGVDAPADELAKAARELVSIYRSDLDEDPPESLTSLAGSKSLQDSETITTSADEAAAPSAAVDSVDARDLKSLATALSVFAQAHLSD